MDLENKFCNTFMRSEVYWAEIHVGMVALTLCNASLNIIDLEKKNDVSSSLYKLYDKRHLGIGDTIHALLNSQGRSPLLSELGFPPWKKNTWETKSVALKLLAISLIVANKKVTKNEAIAKHWIIRTKSWNTTQLRKKKIDISTSSGIINKYLDFIIFGKHCTVLLVDRFQVTIIFLIKIVLG